MSAPADQQSENNNSSRWVNKWTIGAAAILCTVAGAAYTLTRPTKPKKTRQPRPDNRPKTRKYEKSIQKKPLDIHLVMRSIDSQFHAHVAADKKNKKLGLIVGSGLVKINGEKIENESFDSISRKLQSARYPVTLSFRENPELQRQWEEADGLKEEANVVYKEKRLDDALEIMQRAIDLHPTNKIYYSNRVLMLLKKEEYEAALDDCQTIRELDPLSLFVKGHYLRGLVLMNLGKYKHARSAFQTVLKKNSGFKKAHERLNECLEKLAAEAAGPEDQKDAEDDGAAVVPRDEVPAEVPVVVEPVKEEEVANGIPEAEPLPAKDAVPQVNDGEREVVVNAEETEEQTV